MIRAAKIFQFKQASSMTSAQDTKTCYSNVKPGMREWIVMLLLLSFPFFCQSQAGIHIKYLSGQSEILDNENINQNGLQASLEYHFRLKEKRLEFHPGAGYRFSLPSNVFDGHLASFDIDLAASIYPFDFGGDCNCPTFSKEGNLIKKGFFFEVTPGAGYQFITRLRSEPDDPARLPIKSKNLVWKIGGAAGLDIGLSDHFTMTPMISATLLSSAEWEGLHADGSTGILDDQVYLGFGIRFAYTADEKRRRRY
jgi:hypothetical protein